MMEKYARQDAIDDRDTQAGAPTGHDRPTFLWTRLHEPQTAISPCERCDAIRAHHIGIHRHCPEYALRAQHGDR